MRRGGVLLGLALVLGHVAFDARAQNVVYHSPDDNGANPGGAAGLPIGPGESFFLWLDAGFAASPPGTACDNGDGREICGYEVVIDALGSAFFVDFIPQSNVVHRLTPNQLQVNGIFALNPTVGAVRIGELKVANGGVSGAVVVMGGEVVLAALQVEMVSQSTVATVPEPFGWVPLMAGMALLAGLQDRRARSRRRRGNSQII